ncbi:MAG: hypothetical protein OER95_17010 [Acidimicrobiia bacterium]|nr:hypothetical protein [Acidimicrobiia bacterium]
MVASFLRRLLPGGRDWATAAARTSGPPTSANGASSMHLFWEVPPAPLVEVSADLKVVDQPVVDKLYFWALQVNFVGRGADRGGAHTGLQYHPAYPGGRAVNWGGYHPGGRGELDGSISELPSALDNVNTRDYHWRSGRPYRLRVFSPDAGRWRATVTDTTTGAETVIRDLHVDAEHLVRPMVWSEVFADCDHPSVTIRWSNLNATLASGGTVTALSVRTNYQSHGDGGCANTTSSVDPDGRGFLQQTNTARVVGGGTILTLT